MGVTGGPLWSMSWNQISSVSTPSNRRSGSQSTAPSACRSTVMSLGARTEPTPFVQRAEPHFARVPGSAGRIHAGSGGKTSTD